MYKVRIREGNHSVQVTDPTGTVHRGFFSDSEEVNCKQGDHSLLRAVLYAWDGTDDFEISPKDLEDRSQGWWTAPE